MVGCGTLRKEESEEVCCDGGDAGAEMEGITSMLPQLRQDREALEFRHA